MRVGLGEGNDLASPEQSPQLRLMRCATDLRHDGGGHERHVPCLEAYPVLRPDAAVATFCGDENARVVNDRFHLRVRRAPNRGARRRRAAASSCAVSAPCSRSHSATAARPSRTRRARRAAAVIHAERLSPSAFAASITSECTSASTVIASLTAGLPRGIRKPYYRGSIVASSARRRYGDMFQKLPDSASIDSTPHEAL